MYSKFVNILKKFKLSFYKNFHISKRGCNGGAMETIPPNVKKKLVKMTIISEDLFFMPIPNFSTVLQLIW